MTGPLTFGVPGIPQPQGSKRHVGNGRMIESSAKLQPWRDRIVYEARQVMLREGRQAMASANLIVAFRFPRPASVSIKKRPHHTVKPDLDKLIRAVGDALTEAGVVTDDACIYRINALKVYADDPSQAGAVITVVESW